MFDCTLINDELDILEMRLNILDPVIEKFIIVESNKTHSGITKPMHFTENRHRFSKFDHKIIHLVHHFCQLDDIHFQCWTNEQMQRDKFLEALSTVKPIDSLCFVSDVDEIPKPSKLIEAKSLALNTGMPVALELYSCLFYMNYVQLNKEFRGPFLYNPWKAKEIHETKFFQARHNPSYYRWHMCAEGYEGDFPCIKQAGWHFSWLGGVEKIREKLASYAHHEMNKDHFKEINHIVKSMVRGVRISDNNLSYPDKEQRIKIEPIDFLPEHVQSNLEKYKDYIL